MISIISTYSKLFTLKLIKLYQLILSPNHGIFSSVTPYSCRFTPTCSEYMYQAVEKYGVIKGSYKGFNRLFRCHPFSKGGHDPLK